MSLPATASPPPASRTFAVALGVLGTFAIGLAAAAGLAIVRHLDLPGRVPDPSSPAHSPQIAHADTPHVAPDQVREPPYFAPQTIPRLRTPPDEPEEDRAGKIYDPEILELVEIASTLRRDGDTAGALQKLRTADSLMPQHPRILWELATVYKDLSLLEKAKSALAELEALGPAFGGEYYELGTHSLRGANRQLSDNRPSRRGRPPFSFGETLVTADPPAVDGERVTVRLALQSALSEPTPPGDIGLVVQFYDLVDGAAIEETRSDPPTQAWPTAPIDWSGAGIEIVEWGYHMPILTPEEVRAVGQRQYYGYVARLYYRDAIQDVIAEPRSLLALPPEPRDLNPSPMLDDSLFPN